MKFIIATYPKKFKIAAWLISKIDGCNYSHIAMVDDTFELVYQASHGFVNVWHIDNFLEENNVVHIFEWSQFNDTWIRHQLGKKYSIFQLVWIVIYKLTGMKFKSNGDSKFICSEFAGKGMGITADDYTTPKYIVNYLNRMRSHDDVSKS